MIITIVIFDFIMLIQFIISNKPSNNVSPDMFTDFVMVHIHQRLLNIKKQYFCHSNHPSSANYLCKYFLDNCQENEASRNLINKLWLTSNWNRMTTIFEQWINPLTTANGCSPDGRSLWVETKLV